MLPSSADLSSEGGDLHPLRSSPLTSARAPSSISGRMTGALIVYATTFMRYSLAVTPKNYLLFACHFVNFNAQVTQGYRWTNYW